MVGWIVHLPFRGGRPYDRPSAGFPACGPDVLAQPQQIQPVSGVPNILEQDMLDYATAKLGHGVRRLAKLHVGFRYHWAAEQRVQVDSQKSRS